MCVLSVEDNGVGLARAARLGSIGMRLIEGMARSPDGALTIERQKGTRIAVQFPYLQPGLSGTAVSQPA